MNIKKKKLLVTFFIVFTLHAEETDFENIFDPSFEENFQEIEGIRSEILQCDPILEPSFIVEILNNTIGLPAALENNTFYKSTATTNERILLDLPSLQPRFDRSCEWQFDLQAFFNQTRKMFFTKCSPFLSSYLTITSPNILEELNLELFTDANIPDVLALFAPIKLEERRIGMMFSAHKVHNNWSFTAMIPLYWLEHNFFLTQGEQDAIQGNPLFQNFAPACNDSDNPPVQAFAFKHLVSTKLGPGDLRFHFLYNVIEKPRSRGWFGLELTLPSAHNMNGRHINLWLGDIVLFGGNYGKFRQGCPPPLLNLPLLACLFGGNADQIDDGVSLVTDYATQILDTLTANVADRPLGQRNVSFGPYMTYSHSITNYLDWRATGVVDYFIPRKETRFFLAKKNPADFNRDFTSADETVAAENLAFLTQQLSNFFFPYSRDILVHPGFVVKFWTELAYHSDCVNAVVGYDFWFRTQEKLKPSSTLCAQFDINRGIKSMTLQNKIYVNIFGRVPCTRHYVGLRGDFTFSNKGVGRDITIAVDVATSF